MKCYLSWRYISNIPYTRKKKKNDDDDGGMDEHNTKKKKTASIQLQKGIFGDERHTVLDGNLGDFFGSYLETWEEMAGGEGLID